MRRRPGPASPRSSCADLPVGPGPADERLRARLRLMEALVDRGGELRTYPWRLGDLFGLGTAQSSQGPEPLQQGLLPSGSDAWHVVEGRTERALLARLAMVGDRESMRLVAQVLEHEEGLGA